MAKTKAEREKENQLVVYRGVRDLFSSANVQAELEDALPSVLTKENLIRITLTVLRQNQKLVMCSQESLLACLFGSAQLGLTPEPLLGHVYWVPFWSTNLGCNEATLIPGYRGYIKLARRSGNLARVFADVLYSKDKLDMQMGLDEKFNIIPYMDGEDRGDMKGAYTIWTYKDGMKDWLFMPRADILKTKERTKSRNKDGEIVGPWVTDEPEMWKKTPIRRLAKTADLSIEDKTIRAAALAEDLAIDYTPGAQRNHLIPEGLKGPLSITGDDPEGDPEPEFEEVFADLLGHPDFKEYAKLAEKTAGMSLDDFEAAALANEAELRKNFEQWREQKNKPKKVTKTKGKPTAKKSPKSKAESPGKGKKAETTKEAAAGKMSELVKTDEHKEMAQWQSQYPDVYMKIIKEFGQPKTPADCVKITNFIMADPDVTGGGEGPPAD